MNAENGAAGRAFDLFIAGATVQQIIDRLGITAEDAEEAIRDGMRLSNEQRNRLADQSATLLLERTDALFRAHYPQALRGDHRSAEICLRMLDRMENQDRVKGDIVDEIAARRSARGAGSTARSSRSDHAK